MLKINIIKLNSMSVMKKIKCLLLIFTLILLGCNTENEKKTDAPKLESSIIEKIDSSNYLFLDYYFGMNLEQYKKTSENLIKSGKIKKTNDTNNIYIYHIYVGSQLLEASIIPDFSPNLVGIGLLCKSAIDKKPLTAKQIDMELCNMYSDKYGKPDELFESDLINFFINKKILNISNKPFFDSYLWKFPGNKNEHQSILDKTHTPQDREVKYFCWKNSNKIINMNLNYKYYPPAIMGKMLASPKADGNITDKEYEIWLSKQETNNVEIKIYYANAKDLKMREDKQRTEDSTLKANAKKKLNSVIKQNKSDL
jgi:hypothetical protein